MKLEWIGYLALAIAVFACFVGYARNGHPGCVVVAGAVVAFGIFAHRKAAQTAKGSEL